MSTNEIIAAVAAGTMQPDEAAKRLDRQLAFKVSEKGGVSVYGLNSRYPVTLYRDQWLRLLEWTDDLKSFIATNEQSLKRLHADIDVPDIKTTFETKNTPPNAASAGVDAEPTEYTLRRSGLTPISFVGILLKQASGLDGWDNPKRQPTRFYHLAVYHTDSGKYVVQIEYTTNFRSEKGHSEVMILDNATKVAHELIEHDPLDYVAGWPPFPAYEDRQERLLDDLERQYDSLVSKVLDLPEFAERV